MTHCSFKSSDCRRPFLFSHADWPAASKWKSLAYLDANAGHRLIPTELGAEVGAASWREELMPFGRFIKELQAPAYLSYPGLAIEMCVCCTLKTYVTSTQVVWTILFTLSLVWRKQLLAFVLGDFSAKLLGADVFNCILGTARAFRAVPHSTS